MSTATSKGKILLADDEPAILRSYRRVLDRAGYEVEMVENARAGVTAFRAGDFDVVVSDVAMPGMSGLEMLRAIHEHDRDTPVVLITAGPSLETAVQAVEYGALRYLTKPITEDALLDIVSRAIDVRNFTRAQKLEVDLVERAKQARETLGEAFDRMLSGLWMAVQPIVTWSTRSTDAFEALMRSNEPKLPHPGAILAAAEQLARLPDLGRTVRRRVAEMASSLPADADIFVNLHPADIGDEDLFDPNAPLSKIASRVVLEITERSSLAKMPDVIQRMRALRALGFRIAIDDLGAGYAGLNSFTTLEPDVVKLDMGLVRGLDSSTTKQKVIGMIVALCKELGIEVIAEGIETPAERDALIGLGTDRFQGYHFAKPGKPTPVVNWT